MGAFLESTQRKNVQTVSNPWTLPHTSTLSQLREISPVRRVLRVLNFSNLLQDISVIRKLKKKKKAGGDEYFYYLTPKTEQSPVRREGSEVLTGEIPRSPKILKNF